MNNIIATKDLVALCELVLETSDKLTWAALIKAVREERGWCPIQDAIADAKYGLTLIAKDPSHPLHERAKFVLPRD